MHLLERFPRDTNQRDRTEQEGVRELTRAAYIAVMTQARQWPEKGAHIEIDELGPETIYEQQL